ncbi:MAG TPA: cytochrome P460 family protein [Candidatus Deferrimicrobiaceae bacterium]
MNRIAPPVNILCLLAAVVLAAAASTLLAGEKTAALPKDFRSWTHTKSMVIPDKSHGLYGFHTIYANDAALPALKAGGRFPEGAAIVASFYDVVVDGGMTTQGKKRMDVYMEKDKSAGKTGGWVFAAFGPDGKAKVIDPVKDCYQCHVDGAKGTDFVFHKYID